jgi:hypothetical protein
MKAFDFIFSVTIPIGGPNAKNLPATILKYFLADAISISCDGVGMVGGSIAFDATEILAGLIGMNYPDVDEEALNTNLVVKLVA